jgi:hypothetical protein
MDYNKFYTELFRPLEKRLGTIDRDTIFAIIGFDGGGPLSFCTIGREQGEQFITYVSCELAVRDEQQPSEHGRYEFICSCDDEKWVRSIVSNLGRMSLETTFGHGHTIDIGPCATADAPIQAVLLTEEEQVKIAGKSFSIYRVMGICRAELEFKMQHGFAALLSALKTHGVYPNTTVNRASIV